MIATPVAGHPKWRRYTSFTKHLHLRLSLVFLAIFLSYLSPGEGQTIHTTYTSGVLLEQFHDEAYVCESWILVPAENMWARPLRIILYFLALVYAFLGVAIISDIFMSSIEQITATKEEIHTDPDTNQDITITVKVWNETVANLTLMALGSSAPEILLSCVETVARLGKPAGELGPSTIVGSAAFNLFIIIAICVYTIPSSETRMVKEYGVFIITSVASLFAYFWMLVVLEFTTPDEITILEAWLTLGFFPILVLLAYLQDVHWRPVLGRARQVTSATVTDASGHTPSKEAVAELMRKHKNEHQDSDDHTTIRDVAQLAESSALKQKLSRAVYRINAIRMLSAKETLLPRHRKDKDKHSDDVKLLASRKASTTGDYPGGVSSTAGGIVVMDETGRRSSAAGDKLGENVHGLVSFTSKSFSVLESEGSITIHIERTSGTEGRISVDYRTVAGTAKPYEDYKEAQGTVTFEPCETLKTIAVVIVDDNQYEDDENFFVVLTNPTGGAALGRIPKTEVTIIDDDEPGELTFHSGEITAVETEQEVILTVDRVNGSDGEISVTYNTLDGDAIAGKEFEQVTDGILSFTHGESSKTIAITLMDESAYDKHSHFFVELGDTSGGALKGPITKCKITITHDPKVTAMVDKVLARINKNTVNIGEQITTHTWAQQFRDAMAVTGGDAEDDEDDEEDDTENAEQHSEGKKGRRAGGPSHVDFFMHFLTFFWKVIFALCPPTHYGGGWPTFVVSLCFVGVITACVNELASLFGCVLGIPDSITAITFVALGTSLPDTFASKTAAEEEEHADAAIGNVTGSNSVNVFLGLGLPWVIASLYYYARGQKFIVEAGDLGFSVVVYMIGATLALILLVVRRKTVGGELGGRGKAGIAFLLVLCWITYITLTILRIVVGIFK